MYFVDLFCGAGGFTQGLKDAGLRHAVGVEWDPLAAKTYAANHGHVIVKDITRVTGDEIRTYLKGGRLTLLAASPPCQSFSVAAADLQKAADPKDMMYAQVVRLARDLKPDYIIIENVVGILTKKSQSGSLIADDMFRDLTAAGYKSDVRVLKAEEHEVPQLRRRAIIFAARKGLALPIYPTPVTNFDPTIAQCLISPSDIPDTCLVPPGQLKRIRKRIRDKMFVRIQDPTKPAYTAVATHNPWHPTTVLRIPDSLRLRVLTPGELACVQTFPKNYKWTGSQDDRYHQIGNAVPSRLAYWLGKSIVIAIKDAKHDARTMTRKSEVHGRRKTQKRK